MTIPATNSQSAAVTTTMTIEQLPLGKCSEVSLAFSAQAGTEVAGTFGSDVSINFYVLSPQDFDAIQNQKCSLPTGANPLYIQMNSVAHENPYRSLPFPANGTYYFVFVYPNSGISQLSSGHATVELTFPASITLLAASSTQSSSSSNVVATTTQSRTAASTTLSITPSTTPSSHSIFRNDRSHRNSRCYGARSFGDVVHEAADAASGTESGIETGHRKARNEV